MIVERGTYREQTSQRPRVVGPLGGHGFIPTQRASRDSSAHLSRLPHPYGAAGSHGSQPISNAASRRGTDSDGTGSLLGSSGIHPYRTQNPRPYHRRIVHTATTPGDTDRADTPRGRTCRPDPHPRRYRPRADQVHTHSVPHSSSQSIVRPGTAASPIPRRHSNLHLDPDSRHRRRE